VLFIKFYIMILFSSVNCPPI